MAPFCSRFITSAWRTWVSSLRTVVASTLRKRGDLRANWSVLPHLIVAITHSDTLEMACQASAHLARGWNSSKDWLHKGRTLVLGKRVYLLSFCKYICFILSAITAVGRPGWHKVGLWWTNSTFICTQCWAGWQEAHWDYLRGGPVVARLGPLLFLPGWPGGLLRHRIQGDLGPSCRAWTPSILPNLILRGGVSEKKAILDRRKARLKLSLLEQSAPLVSRVNLLRVNSFFYVKCEPKSSQLKEPKT